MTKVTSSEQTRSDSFLLHNRKTENGPTKLAQRIMSIAYKNFSVNNQRLASFFMWFVSVGNVKRSLAGKIVEASKGAKNGENILFLAMHVLRKTGQETNQKKNNNTAVNELFGDQKGAAKILIKAFNTNQSTSFAHLWKKISWVSRSMQKKLRQDAWKTQRNAERLSAQMVGNKANTQKQDTTATEESGGLKITYTEDGCVEID